MSGEIIPRFSYFSGKRRIRLFLRLKVASWLLLPKNEIPSLVYGLLFVKGRIGCCIQTLCRRPQIRQEPRHHLL